MIHLRAARPTRPVLTRTLALLAAGAAAVLVVGCGSEPADPDAVPSAAASTTAPAASPSASAPSGSATPSTTAPSTTAPSTTAAPADTVALDITLANGTVSPNGQKIDVRRGQTVALTVTSDHDDTVHVHGDYDVELEVKAGTTVMESFVADKTGSVEVESHHPEKIIAILNIR